MDFCTIVSFSNDLFLHFCMIVRSMDHSKYDCFVCCIMSHGGEGDVIAAYDDTYAFRHEIRDKFTTDKCPSLAGKPKIFIIQVSIKYDDVSTYIFLILYGHLLSHAAEAKRAKRSNVGQRRTTVIQ